MDTFVQLINAEDGHPVLVRVGAINQIQARDEHSCYILLQDEDGVLVVGTLTETLSKINDAIMVTAGAEASMSAPVRHSH